MLQRLVFASSQGLLGPALRQSQMQLSTWKGSYISIAIFPSSFCAVCSNSNSTMQLVLSRQSWRILFKLLLFSTTQASPFCNQGALENSSHMFEARSAWAHIRRRFPLASDAQLPTCTRFTGIACLTEQSLHFLRLLYVPQPALPAADALHMRNIALETQHRTGLSNSVSPDTVQSRSFRFRPELGFVFGIVGPLSPLISLPGFMVPNKTWFGLYFLHSAFRWT